MKLFEVQGESHGEVVMSGFVVADNEDDAVKQVDDRYLTDVYVFEVKVKGYNIILEETKQDE